MRSQVLACTRQLVSQPASLRLRASSMIHTRTIFTARSLPSATHHTTLCRCLSCSSSPLFSSRPSPSLVCATTTTSWSHRSILPARSFATDTHTADDAHTEHSHGDFLPRHTVEQRVIAVLSNIEKLHGTHITSHSTWQELGLDSLDEVEVVMQLEDEFMVDLYDPDAVKIRSVPEAVEAFSNFPFAM